MRNDKGGSSHDPHKKLPLPMWARSPRDTDVRCNGCRQHSDPNARKTFKKAVQATGSYPGVYLICPRCDGRLA